MRSTVIYQPAHRQPIPLPGIVWNRVGDRVLLLRRVPRHHPDGLHVWRIEGGVSLRLAANATELPCLGYPYQKLAQPGRLAVDALDLLSPADGARWRLGVVEFAFFRSPYDWRLGDAERWHCGLMARATDSGDWEAVHYFGRLSSSEIALVARQSGCPWRLIELRKMPELRRPEAY